MGTQRRTLVGLAKAEELSGIDQETLEMLVRKNFIDGTIGKKGIRVAKGKRRSEDIPLTIDEIFELRKYLSDIGYAEKGYYFYAHKAEKSNLPVINLKARIQGRVAYLHRLSEHGSVMVSEREIPGIPITNIDKKRGPKPLPLKPPHKNKKRERKQKFIEEEIRKIYIRIEYSGEKQGDLAIEYGTSPNLLSNKVRDYHRTNGERIKQELFVKIRKLNNLHPNVKLLTIREASKILGRAKRLVREYIDNRLIRGYRRKINGLTVYVALHTSVKDSMGKKLPAYQ